MIQKEIEETTNLLAQQIEAFTAENKTKTRGIDKQPALGFIAKILLPIGFTALEGIAGQIKDETAKKYTLFALGALSEFVSILTDSEKPDKMTAIAAWLQETAPEKEKALIELATLLVTNTRMQDTKKQMILNMLERIEKLIK